MRIYINKTLTTWSDNCSAALNTRAGLKPVNSLMGTCREGKEKKTKDEEPGLTKNKCKRQQIFDRCKGKGMYMFYFIRQ